MNSNGEVIIAENSDKNNLIGKVVLRLKREDEQFETSWF
jgi:hypothetical protein